MSLKKRQSTIRPAFQNVLPRDQNAEERQTKYPRITGLNTITGTPIGETNNEKLKQVEDFGRAVQKFHVERSFEFINASVFSANEHVV